MTTIRQDAILKFSDVNFNFCPSYYGYIDSSKCSEHKISCSDCWDREVEKTLLMEVCEAFPEIPKGCIIRNYCPSDFGYKDGGKVSDHDVMNCENIFLSCLSCWGLLAENNKHVKAAKKRRVENG